MQEVPAGLSQLGHLPIEENSDHNTQEWNFDVDELSDTEDCSHFRKVLSCHYNDVYNF
jgi:hypothetical protein